MIGTRFHGILLAFLALLPGAAARPAGAGEPTPRAWSVQLHVHGSYSEGVGSIDSHSHEATDVGADAIWWSDHDFRVTSYHHASSFGFEDWTEPIDRGESWRDFDWLPRGRADDREEDAGPPRKGLRRNPLRSLAGGGGAIVADRADEGAHSLRVRAVGDGADFAGHLYLLKASRSLFKRPLGSGVSLGISVFPEKTGPDARAVVEIGLSEHAPRADLPMQELTLRYRLGGEASPATRRGTVVEVGLPLVAGRWNRLLLPVSRDAAAGFPSIRAGDDSMGSIAIGVESRHGAEASVLFDRFRIEQRLAGDLAWKRQAKLIDEVAADYPRLAEMQGSEISYASHHLNEFSLDTRPIDYDALLARVRAEVARKPGLDPGDEVDRRIVAKIHARGGLVSYNHMYGAPMEGGRRMLEVDRVRADLLANRLFGADILEVGYRDRGGHDLADHLRIWDDLAARGLFPVGVGVSDSHGGSRQRWRTSANNFLTWIFAPAPIKPDLLAGLRAGRAFFGDRTLFDGSVDLVSGRGFRMGQIVVTDRPREEVAISIRGLGKGDVVRVVEGSHTESLSVEGDEFAAKRPVEIAPEGTTLLRIEADAASGTAKVLSNAIVFVRRAPEGGLPGARAGFDVGGLVATRLDGFRLDGVATVPAAAPAAVEAVSIRGRATGARIEIDASDFGVPAVVESTGSLAGTWEWRPPRLLLDGLRGDGEIRVRRADAGTAAAPHGPQPIRRGASKR